MKSPSLSVFLWMIDGDKISGGYRVQVDQTTRATPDALREVLRERSA